MRYFLPFYFMPSLTVIMLAYNEKDYLRFAYERTKKALCLVKIFDYEIIIVTTVSPNGFHDGTPDIAKEISEKDYRVRHIHNEKYVGMGHDYFNAVKMAVKDYVIMVPGADEIEEESLVNIFGFLGKAELIIVYTVNKKLRSLKTRIVSGCYTFLCNLLFGLYLKYYNGISMLPTRFVQAVPLSANSPAYASEILIYLLKSGAKDYLEVPQTIRFYSGRTFTSRNAKEGFKTLASLFWKIHFKRERLDLNNLRKIIYKKI